MREEYPKRQWLWFSATTGERGWGVPKERRLRVVLVIGCLLSLPILSAVLNGVLSVPFAMSAGLCVGFSVIYLIFSSFPHQREVLKETDVSNFYPRWYLIFEALVVVSLVGFVIYRLWVQFPR